MCYPYSLSKMVARNEMKFSFQMNVKLQVRAVRNGQILVVDEADKASVHVIAVLKSLLDEGMGELREKDEKS